MDIQCPKLIKGDNLEILRTFPSKFVDLVYFDPPFFTGKRQRLRDRLLVNGQDLSFNDIWKNHEEYLTWIRERLRELRRVLKDTGSIFLHCDWHANHLLRVELDEVFHPSQFRGEIIWYYRRWTNAVRSFQHAHQTIYFYSKTKDYKFYPMYEEYSFTTNIDQIWQRRERDDKGKCVTAGEGDHIPLGKDKPGVPMRDVWEIPYVNPKANERTGYPTQKPVELLQRIILTSTDRDNIVLDPACGSGTTLVAAKALRRRWIGIDISKEALDISEHRLAHEKIPDIAQAHHTPYKLASFLKLPHEEKIKQIAMLLDMNIVHRNKNLDGILKKTVDGKYVAVRYIEHEYPEESLASFVAASKKRKCELCVVVMPRVNELDKLRWEKKFNHSVGLSILSCGDISSKKFTVGTLFHHEQTTFSFR